MPDDQQVDGIGLTGEKTARDLYREPLRAGEAVLIIDDRGKQHLVSLREDGQFHHRRVGTLAHTAIIGRPPGTRFRTEAGREVVCLRPTLQEFILKRLRRRTQIIYPKDLSLILLSGDIFPGAQVLEAGIGSGATALVLLRFLGPGGHLISYEHREEFARLAQQNLAEAHRLYGKPGARHTIQIRNVYEGIEEHDLDAILLDLPEPHRAAPFAAEALRPGGVLLCWLPTVLQVHTLVRHLQDDPCWSAIETVESILRPWEVNGQSIRPAQRIVGHTGFLIRARRVETER